MWGLGIILHQVQRRAVHVHQRIQIRQPRQQLPVRSANVSVRRGMVERRPVRVQCAQAEPIKPVRATARVRHVEQGIIAPVVLRVRHVHRIVPTPQQPRPQHPVRIRVYVWQAGI